MKTAIILLCLLATVGCYGHTYTEEEINTVCVGAMGGLLKRLGPPIAQEHMELWGGGAMYWSYLLVPNSTNYTVFKFHTTTAGGCYIN